MLNENEKELLKQFLWREPSRKLFDDFAKKTDEEVKTEIKKFVDEKIYIATRRKEQCEKEIAELQTKLNLLL